MARSTRSVYSNLGGVSNEAVIHGAGSVVLISGSTVLRLSDHAARTLVVEWLRYEIARRPGIDVVDGILRDADSRSPVPGSTEPV